MRPNYAPLIKTLKSLDFLSRVTRGSKIPNELEALEAYAKSLYLNYLEEEQWPQVTLTIDTVCSDLQRAFMRAYSDVRIGDPTHWFPTIEGTWWAWPPPPSALRALDPSGHLKSVTLPPSQHWPEDMEVHEEVADCEDISDRI